MKIGSENEFVELVKLERNSVDQPASEDTNFEVKLKLQEFSGRYTGVWIELASMQEFLQQLELLEKSRNGFASISSLSPGEFKLEIRSSDDLGHMEVEVQLQHHQYSGPKYWPVTLSGGFEVEPDTVGELMSCFKQFTS